ncbi:MAG: glycosyl transferase family protein, partial [Solirubrobacteraceae bacterium]
DLFIDIVFCGRWLWRRLVVYSRYPPMRAEDLRRSGPAGRFAVFVPAWREAGVIGDMLRHFVRRTVHDNYRVFVGVYPNDPDTASVVAGIADPRVEMVVTPRPGSTTKADCLNALWHAMLRHEIAFGGRFKAIVLHDAEDVAHSLELRIFDHLIPAKAMVQLPVAPIRDPDSHWIAGHYLDEFAENHGKDIVVREALGAAVPSAGVACAFERGVMGWIADDLGGAPFDPVSLTEDYELGLRIAARGGSAAMVRIPGHARGRLVATREHFPATLDAALQQKTRWLLGIALQGWDRIRWQGGVADRYMLLRDRKALLNAFIVILAYLGGSAFAGSLLLGWLLPAATALPAVVEPGDRLGRLLAFTTLLLVWRLFVRAAFTARMHGPVEALRSVPRAAVANLINCLAAIRAIAWYCRIAARRDHARWDKTAHRVPVSAPAE